MSMYKVHGKISKIKFKRVFLFMQGVLEKSKKNMENQDEIE